MPDNLLYLNSTVASISVVLAFALVVDARANARRWSNGGYGRGQRITSTVMHIIAMISIFLAFTISIGQLLANANDIVASGTASVLAGLAFGMLGIGVLGGPITVGLMKDPTGAMPD